MTPRQASAVIARLLDMAESQAPGSSMTVGLTCAKQALDILATLEERLNLSEPVTIKNCELEWAATRGHRTHLGGDLTEALGQLCTTLALEDATDEANALLNAHGGAGGRGH